MLLSRTYDFHGMNALVLSGGQKERKAEKKKKKLRNEYLF